VNEPLADPGPTPAAAVRHNAPASRFELDVAGGLAVASYRRDGDTLVLTHTEVPRQSRRHGLAAALVRATLDWARAEGLRVRPLCSYAAAYIRHHPETQDLLAGPTR
jgi:predicted GNAT family acetyltransferase